MLLENGSKPFRFVIYVMEAEITCMVKEKKCSFATVSDSRERSHEIKCRKVTTDRIVKSESRSVYCRE